MHHAREKVIPIANSDDKCQVTAVIAATLTGEPLPPQIIYKGKTKWCHPKGMISKDLTSDTVIMTGPLKIP